MKLKLLFLLSVIIFPICAYSQWIPKQLMTDPHLKDENSNKFSFDAHAVGFFKDNEYFSPIWKGATYPGTRFRPTIGYQIGNKFRADVGITTLLYSGDRHGLDKDNLYVYFRMQYAVTPDFFLVLGNYYGNVNHQLLEPLYKWEDCLIGAPESGAQLLYKNDKYFADVWINWQRFNRRGDNYPEMLTFGVSTSAILTDKNNPFKVKIPLQLLIHHQGGQIDVSNEKMLVTGNLATGVETEYAINGSFIKSVGIDMYGLGYFDKLPDKTLRPFRSGWGIYPVVSVKSSNLELMAGYWYAKKFYCYTGEPLFASFNDFYPGQMQPTRHLVTAKLSYSRRVCKMLALGAMGETYSDLDRGETDYAFGVYLRFDYSLAFKKK